MGWEISQQLYGKFQGTLMGGLTGTLMGSVNWNFDGKCKLGL